MFDDIKQKIQAYLYAYGDSEPPFHEMEDAFKNLFHDSFYYTMKGMMHMNTDQMREAVKILLSHKTTKAEIVHFSPMGSFTFEVKLLIVNEIAVFRTHSKGTIQDGKIIRMDEYEDAKPSYLDWHKIVGLSELKHNFTYFVELQNDSGISLDGIGDAFDRLFCDDLIAAITRVQMKRRGMRTTSSDLNDFSQAFGFSQANFLLENCQVMDKDHLEVEVHKLGFNERFNLTREVWHDVLTVKDGTIVMIEPYIDFKKVTAKKGELVKRNHLISSSPHGPVLLLMMTRFC